MTSPARRTPLHRLFAALVGLALVSPLAAQTTIGFVPNADQNATNTNFYGSMSSSTAWIIPFRYTTLDNYQLNSVSLLLSGNASLTDFSVIATATAPNDLTVPAALATFTTIGSLGALPTAYSFTTGNTTSLTQNTIYYIRVTYTGSDTANWVKSSGIGDGSGFTGSGVAQIEDHPLDSAFSPGYAVLTYRQVSSGPPVNDFGGQNEGFSITAGTAIPEPGTSAAWLGGASLLVFLSFQFSRRNRTESARSS